MSIALKSLLLAALVAATQAAGVAGAQAPKTAATPELQPVPAAAKAPIPTGTPEDWIVFDDLTYTPVVDDVSRHLDAARKAFDAKDDKTAAAEMRAAAKALEKQAARADEEDRAMVRADKAMVRADKALLAEDAKIARDGIKRMNAGVQKVNSAATAIESGKITTKGALDKAIDKAARADLERRWLVTDETVWYPVSEEPQRHFTDAVAAYARKDYQAAAADIRKATGYLRLEAARANGAARQALDGAVSRLDALAAAVARGALKDDQSMDKAFAQADHALALAHRAKAAESWARKDYGKAGYELKAAAHGLESAAGWVGSEAKAGAAASVADARALGEKLAAGGIWTRDEVARDFEALGESINAVGRKIAGTTKAAAIAVGG